jgi:hypothetical protein
MELFVSVANVHEPVNHTYHDRAANDVSNRNWQEIGNKEITLGEMRKISGCFAKHFKKLWISKVLDK